jgi:hypothetical protein
MARCLRCRLLRLAWPLAGLLFLALTAVRLISRYTRFTDQ